MATIEELTERVAFLEQIVGLVFATVPPTEADFNPASELPSGRYPLLLSDYQMRLDSAAVWRAIAALRSGAAPSQDASATDEIADGSDPTIPAGTRIVRGDTVFVDRVGIGGLHPKGLAPLHIVENRAKGHPASVLYWSNIDRSQYQEAAQHVAEEALSDDGGFRRGQNCMASTDTRMDFDPDTGQSYPTHWIEGVNPNKPFMLEGFDSQGQPSWNHRYPASWLADRGLPANFYDRTQTVVMRFDPMQKLVLLECWQRDWRFKFGADAKYGPGYWTGPMP